MLNIHERMTDIESQIEKISFPDRNLSLMMRTILIVTNQPISSLTVSYNLDIPPHYSRLGL